MPILEQQVDKKMRVAIAAKHYGVSTPAIWNWLRLGKITRFKLGAVTLVSLREIEELMAKDTAAAASEEAKQARIDEAVRRKQVRVTKTRSTRSRRLGAV
jgi:hypothetical protein